MCFQYHWLNMHHDVNFDAHPNVSKWYTCYNTAMPGMPEPFWIYANVSSMRHTIVGESEMYAFSHEAEDYYRDPSEVCTRLDQNVYSSIVWYSPKEPCCFIENGYRNFSKLETGILGIKEGFERRRQSESLRKLNLWSIQKEDRVMLLWTFFAGPFRRWLLVFAAVASIESSSAIAFFLSLQ